MSTTPYQLILLLQITESINRRSITYLTPTEVKAFFEVVMGHVMKHINALREEGINHPKDLANFDSDDFKAVIGSVKEKQSLLSGLAQIRLNQTSDCFQFILDTRRKMKDHYLTAEAIKSHAIQFKAIKDQKDSKDSPSGLPELLKSTNSLAWINRVDKTLRKLPG